MNIQVKVEASAVAVLALEGRLTAGAGAATLTHAVDTILERGYVDIVLDLRRVEQTDCAGIGQLLNCYRKTRQRGGSLRIAHVACHLRMLLALFRLESVLETFESEQAALASLVATGARAPTLAQHTVWPDMARRPVRFPVSRSQTAS